MKYLGKNGLLLVLYCNAHGAAWVFRALFTFICQNSQTRFCHHHKAFFTVKKPCLEKQEQDKVKQPNGKYVIFDYDTNRNWFMLKNNPFIQAIRKYAYKRR